MKQADVKILTWEDLLRDELEKPYMKELKRMTLFEAQSGHEVYPPKSQIFNAFKLTPFESVKVVVVGQDPYHGKNQAHGLSFSVCKGIKIPPSLQNIYKELKDDLEVLPPNHGCLESWAKQGVLLLNATLTVRAKMPKSHYGKGWERFTDFVISLLAERKQSIVFILWGRSAYEKCERIFKPNLSRHLILTSAHPSPYSAYNGFFGSKPFSKANHYLEEKGLMPINWQIND